MNSYRNLEEDGLRHLNYGAPTGPLLIILILKNRGKTGYHFCFVNMIFEIRTESDASRNLNNADYSSRRRAAVSP